jgi:spore coat protein A, manganese oxidase
MISRREFVKIGTALGAGMLIPTALLQTGCTPKAVPKPVAPSLLPKLLMGPPADPLRLTKFVDALPIMGLMPAASPNHYKVGAYQFLTNVHSQMPPTTAWGYRPLGFVPDPTKPETTWLAPSFAIPRGTRTKVEWHNKLNRIRHPLPVDPSIMFADPLGDAPKMGTVYPVDSAGRSTFDYTMNTVPLTTHVHGGEQPPGSDGGPYGWFTPDLAQTGPEWANSGDIQTNFDPTGKHNVYPYYNNQLPATIWYHDHTLGLDRLNVYMGLAGAYVIYDTALEPVGVPSVLDTVTKGVKDKFGQPYDIPLVIQDRIFDAEGHLWYPVFEGTNPKVHPFWTPEFFGDTICVNGVAWPKLRVEPRKYRFRVLDGSNARFYNLTLWDETAKGNGPGFQVIAGDSGYLAGPAAFAPGRGLLIAPGERYEIVVDFSAFAGHSIVMRNDANAPFPGGDAETLVNADTTAQIMQFEVDAAPVTDKSSVPAALNSVLGTVFPSITSKPTFTRQLTLNELEGEGGPLAAVLNYSPLSLSTTELPRLKDTEVWRIVNMTGDAHPIHLHLVSFQVKSRQAFDAEGYDKAWNAAFLGGKAPSEPNGPPLAYKAPGTTLPDGSTLVGGNPDVTPFLKGKPTPAAPKERGWKDTVQMMPEEVTEIIVRFSPNDETPDFPFDATAPLGYVWHCHILEHEENDMMRRYTVMPAGV